MSLQHSDIVSRKPALKNDVIIKEGKLRGYIITKSATYVVNESALDILHLCNGKYNVIEIASILSQKYSEDINTILNDVITFLKQMIEINILELI